MAGTKKTSDMSLQLKLTVILIAALTTAALALWAVYVARATEEPPPPELAASVQNWATAERPGVQVDDITHHGQWPTCGTATVEYADGDAARVVSVFDNGWKSAKTDASVTLRQVKTEERCLEMARTGVLPGE